MEIGACNPPLYEKTITKSKLYRCYLSLHLVLLVCFLGYRLLNLLDGSYGLSNLAFVCEMFFALQWVLYHNMRWVYIKYKTYPDRLAQRYSGELSSKLPAVDIIVTTTDPYKEPALITANTVLSVLAFDYPVEKIACYISDDGASPITFYSLIETCSFAKKWVPYCRKFNIQTRAPFMYFSKEAKSSDSDFIQEWQKMKDEYENLKRRIKKALETGQVPSDMASKIDVDSFAYTSSDIRNHPSIVKVIHENKATDGKNDSVLPHLVYVAREKRPQLNHHYKAGAMNVMARVSALMTNAPFILNLDSDMHVSDPKAIQQAMCLFLGCKSEKECGFVQFPQIFYGGLKDDPFGNQMTVVFNTIAYGMNEIQGVLYGGTCCFHRRKGLYGLPPDANQCNGKVHDPEDLPYFLSSYESLRKAFGESSRLVAAAQNILWDTPHNNSSSPSTVNDEALKVSSCHYELNTLWGKKVGWMYGSTVEDVMTGLKIHSLGWYSICYSPEQPAFLGCAPGNGPDTLVQQQRWATGLLEIFVSKLCPFVGIKRRIKLRQRMAYAYFNLWAIWSVPVLCYSIVPALCLVRGTYFLPKISDQAAFPLGVALFISIYGYRLVEYLSCGCSWREWWNNQRMWFISCISSWFLALFDVLMKSLGLSQTVFIVTPKESEEDEQVGQGDFTFDSSPLFVLPTTILLMNLAGIFWSTISFLGGTFENSDKPFAEYFCSIWVVFNLWPFVKGLVGKGKRGIPWSVIVKSSVFAAFLCSIRS